MKILTPQQLKEVETQTVSIQGIDFINLMERAATAVFEWLKARLDLTQNHFTIICGVGNNGGDGLALARLLVEEGADVKVYLQRNNTYSLDNLTNQKKLKEKKIPIEFYDEETRFEFQSNTYIIDAIFGYGLTRPIGEEWKSVIQQINDSPNTVISIDVPSGLYCDKINSPDDYIVESEVTLTFQTPKLSLFLPENQRYVQSFEILDIHLDWESMEKQDSKMAYFSPQFLPKFYFNRPSFSHKYQYGNILIIGGGYGKIGAVQMAARAALRAGAGLVTVYIPKCGYSILQTAVPEAMVMTDFSEDKIIQFPDVSRFTTLIVGPGLGTDEKTFLAFEQLLTEQDIKQKKILIDADGINLLAQKLELLKYLPEETILTPHDGELKRLIGDWENSYDKIKKVQAFAQRHKLILISKGFHTQTYLPNGEIIFNSSGNPGMATAGCGDVLAGVIGGCYAKGYTAGDAALFGVFLHGYSGDLAAGELGEESLIAGDLIQFLPLAFKKLFG